MASVLCACASGCMSGLSGKWKGLAHSSGYEADTVHPDSLTPSRQPYEGFVWDEVRGPDCACLPNETAACVSWQTRHCRAWCL